MATADATNAKATGSSGVSFSFGLWQRWLRKRRRDRARLLSQVRFRLTREGVHFIGILIFIFFGAVIREINLLILLAGAMIGLLLLQWRFSTGTMTGLQVDRMLPRNTKVNRDTEIGLRLRNPKYWLGAWLVLIEDPLQMVQPMVRRLPERGATLFDAVNARGKAPGRYQLCFHERGEYLVGPSTITTRFPLGLGRSWRTVDNAARILVHPKPGVLTSKFAELLHHDRAGEAKASSNPTAQEGEFYGLRPWETGDSKRWIHWRTTARLGELSVRQFEQRQQKQICVLLDMFSSKDIAHADLEKSLAFVATLANAAISKGRDKLSVAVASSETNVYTAVQSAVLVENLLDRLAVVKASEKPDLLSAVRGLSVPIQSNPYLLVVSTRGDQMSRLMSAASDSLTRRMLLRVRTRWINVSAGELESYFQWT